MLLAGGVAIGTAASEEIKLRGPVAGGDEDTEEDELPGEEEVTEGEDTGDSKELKGKVDSKN